MKKQFSVRIVALVTFLTLTSVSLRAADYYVVIGTFADETNAKKYTSQVRDVFNDVSYSFNETRKLYYVHVFKTSLKEEARNWSLYLRHEKGFRDAWVLSFGEVDNILLAEKTVGSDNTQYIAKASEIKALQSKQTTSIQSGNATSVQSTTTASTHARNTASTATSPTTTTTAPTTRAPRYSHATTESANDDHVLASAGSTSELAKYTPAPAENKAAKTLAWDVQGDISFAKDIDTHANITSNPALAKSQVFTFVVEDKDGKELPSEVMLVNFEKVKKIASFHPGEHVAVKAAKKNQMVTFVCEVLGYAMETRMFNIDHLSRGRDIRKTDDGVWEVRFKMRKLQVDEIVFMNRTTFYPDAAVLDPSSDVEMNELLAMMQNNAGYKIVLHGHCNPASRREVKVPAGTNYYSLEEAGTVNASDKQLTRLRAETIRNFLIDHGIDKRRIGVVGWGSVEPLVSATAEDAYVNNRIELELVAE